MSFSHIPDDLFQLADRCHKARERVRKRKLDAIRTEADWRELRSGDSPPAALEEAEAIFEWVETLTKRGALSALADAVGTDRIRLHGTVGLAIELSPTRSALYVTRARAHCAAPYLVDTPTGLLRHANEDLVHGLHEAIATGRVWKKLRTSLEGRIRRLERLAAFHKKRQIDLQSRVDENRWLP